MSHAGWTGACDMSKVGWSVSSEEIIPLSGWFFRLVRRLVCASQKLCLVQLTAELTSVWFSAFLQPLSALLFDHSLANPLLPSLPSSLSFVLPFFELPQSKFWRRFVQTPRSRRLDENRVWMQWTVSQKANLVWLFLTLRQTLRLTLLLTFLGCCSKRLISHKFLDHIPLNIRAGQQSINVTWDWLAFLVTIAYWIERCSLSLTQ